MISPQQKLQAAQAFAMANRPTVGGFPFLAECLRQAGTRTITWSLPAAQSLSVMDTGSVVQQGTPLLTGMAEVPRFDQEALVTALRTDQAGQSTFPEFLMSAWQAGVVRYVVDLRARVVTYYGAQGEQYEESYPSVDVPEIVFE